MRLSRLIRRVSIVVSVALCALFLILWALNSRFSFSIAEKHGVLLQVRHGTLLLAYFRDRPAMAPGFHAMTGKESWDYTCSFYAINMPSYWLTFVPLWFAAMASGTAAVLSRRIHLHLLRKEHMFCPTCFYDRTGLKSGACCPECGAASFEPVQAVA